MIHEKTSTTSKFILAAGLAAYVVLSLRAMPKEIQNDAAVYRAGVKVALEGKSPYNTALIQQEVAAVFPPEKPDDLALNCGFFLPPQAIAMFAPFAKTDPKQQSAALVWWLVLTLFGVCVGTLAWAFGRVPGPNSPSWAVIILALLLNPVTQLGLVVGQTSLIFVGSIALGQYCFERNHPRFGCFLWALTFVKPHLAIMFFVMAWLLGGWKRAAGIGFFVAALNLLGGFLVRPSMSGPVDLFFEYMRYIGSAHKDVTFNQIAINYQIASWNRMVVALGGPAIDLKIWMILAGFTLWSILILFRTRCEASWRAAFDPPRRDDGYYMAAAAAGSLFFTQPLGYELVLLVLITPLMLRLFDAEQRNQFVFLVGLLAFLMIPIDFTNWIAQRCGFAENSRAETILLSHKCFGIAVLILYLLVRGPTLKPSPSSGGSERPRE